MNATNRILPRQREKSGHVTITADDRAHYEALILAMSPCKSQDNEQRDHQALPRVWHVAVTNPGCERRVSAQMAERGLDTFLPMIRYTRYRSRTHLIGEKPLLPRYVMFRREFADQRVDKIDGLERIVRSDDQRWAKVPDSLVHELRVRTISREFEASRHGTEFMKWLVRQGELPGYAILLPKEGGKTKQNRVGRVARKRKR